MQPVQQQSAFFLGSKVSYFMVWFVLLVMENIIAWFALQATSPITSTLIAYSTPFTFFSMTFAGALTMSACQFFRSVANRPQAERYQNKVYSHFMVFILCVSVMVAVMMWLFIPLLLDMYQLKSPVLETAVQYSRWTILSLPFNAWLFLSFLCWRN